jgi:acetoin utilization protein AcuB
MKTDVISIETTTSIMEAQNIMRKKNIKRLPVMKKGKLVGLVTKHMLLEAEGIVKDLEKKGFKVTDVS